jgi:hypothetical protein
MQFDMENTGSNKEMTAAHERSRRELALSVMREWNRDVKIVTAAAAKLVTRLSKEQCRDVIENKPI